MPLDTGTVTRSWLGGFGLCVLGTALWSCATQEPESLGGDAPVTQLLPVPPPSTPLAVTGPAGAGVATPEVSPDGRAIAFTDAIGRALGNGEASAPPLLRGQQRLLEHAAALHKQTEIDRLVRYAFVRGRGQVYVRSLSDPEAVPLQGGASRLTGNSSWSANPSRPR